MTAYSFSVRIFFPIVRISRRRREKKENVFSRLSLSLFLFANLCITVRLHLHSIDSFLYKNNEEAEKENVRICQIQGTQSLPAIVFFLTHMLLLVISLPRWDHNWIRLMHPIETVDLLSVDEKSNRNDFQLCESKWSGNWGNYDYSTVFLSLPLLLSLSSPYICAYASCNLVSLNIEEIEVYTWIIYRDWKIKWDEIEVEQFSSLAWLTWIEIFSVFVCLF